ncbi:hypothetical protein [Gordonia rhizosphera]|nr:hypothetical protein [Gordonia rhizosphera]
MARPDRAPTVTIFSTRASQAGYGMLALVYPDQPLLSMTHAKKHFGAYLFSDEAVAAAAPDSRVRPRQGHGAIHAWTPLAAESR